MVDQTIMNARARAALVHARKATDASGIVRAAAADVGPEVATRVPAGARRRIAVARGRTVPWDNFESTRFDVEVGAAVEDPEDAMGCYEDVRAFVEEWIAREEASLRRSGRPEGPLPAMPYPGRWVELSYGMTIRGADRFDMHRIDVTLTVPVADGADLGAALEAISADLGAQLAAEDRRVRATFRAPQP